MQYSVSSNGFKVIGPTPKGSIVKVSMTPEPISSVLYSKTKSGIPEVIMSRSTGLPSHSVESVFSNVIEVPAVRIS